MASPKLYSPLAFNPTSAPGSPSNGWFYYDSTLLRMESWDGAAWQVYLTLTDIGGFLNNCSFDNGSFHGLSTLVLTVTNSASLTGPITITPQATPVTNTNGVMYYDSTLKRLETGDGTLWNQYVTTVDIKAGYGIVVTTAAGAVTVTNAMKTKSLGTVTSTAGLDFSNSTGGQLNSFVLTSATPCTVSVTTGPPTGVMLLALRITTPTTGSIAAITWPASFNGFPQITSLALNTTYVLLCWFDSNANYYYIPDSILPASFAGVTTTSLTATSGSVTGLTALAATGGAGVTGVTALGTTIRNLATSTTFSLTPTASHWYRVGTIAASTTNGQSVDLLIDVNGTGAPYAMKLRLVRGNPTSNIGTEYEFQLIGLSSTATGISNVRVVDGGSGSAVSVDIQFANTSASTIVVSPDSWSNVGSGGWFVMGTLADQGTGAAGTVIDSMANSFVRGDTSNGHAMTITRSAPAIGGLNFTYIPIHIGTVTTTCAVNWANGGSQDAQTTNATNCAVSFTAPPAPCELVFALKGPASGTSGTITWPTFKGTAPTTTGIATGTTRMVWIWYDGTNYWQTATQTA